MGSVGKVSFRAVRVGSDEVPGDTGLWIVARFLVIFWLELSGMGRYLGRLGLCCQVWVGGFGSGRILVGASAVMY